MFVRDIGRIIRLEAASSENEWFVLLLLSQCVAVAIIAGQPGF
jgi:hypothetical protein